MARKPGTTAFELSNNAQFQGGVYAAGRFLASNNASFSAVVISDDFQVENNAAQHVPVPVVGGATVLQTYAPTTGALLLANVAGSWRSHTP